VSPISAENSWRALGATTEPDAAMMDHDSADPDRRARCHDSPEDARADAPVEPVDRIEPQHLHVLSPLSTALLAALRVWPIWLVAVTRAEGSLFIIAGVGLLVWRVAVWVRTTYEVGSEGLIIRSGIVWRNVQTIPPQRIQQVDQRRGIRHRALGLVELRLGLAGTGEANEVSLDSLGEQQAERLATMLERWRKQEPHPARDGSAPPSALAPPQPPAQTLLRVTPSRLVIAGLTSRSLWLAPLAAIAATLQLLSDVGLGDESQDTVRRGLDTVSPAVLIVVVLVLSSVASTVFTVISHFDLTVEQHGSQVEIRRGLLEKRRATLPLARVQVVQLGTNPIRRLLGLATLDVRTADLGGDIGSGLHSASIPIGERAELAALAAVLLSASSGMPMPEPVLDPHPRAASRRAVIRRGVRIGPPAAMAGWWLMGVGGVVVFTAAALVIALVAGLAYGASLATGVNEHGVVTQRGAVAWRRWTVPLARVQSVGLLANPFQRRLGLVTVRLDIAGAPGGVVIPDIGIDQALLIVAATRTCPQPDVLDVIRSDARRPGSEIGR